MGQCTPVRGLWHAPVGKNLALKAGQLSQLLVSLLGDALMGRIYLALLHSSCRLCSGMM